jgi:hypothetical protein
VAVHTTRAPGAEVDEALAHTVAMLTQQVAMDVDATDPASPLSERDIPQAGSDDRPAGR